MMFMVWNFDPILISFLKFNIHWYGVLFASAIFIGFQIMKRFYINERVSLESLDALLIYCVVGIVVGARLGHCIFYDPQYYFTNILRIFAIWEGGLASHGGGIGVAAAVFFYAKKYKVKLFWIVDRLTIPTALFGFFVRIANFLNSEILGKPSNEPWAIVFKRIDDIPRHPVQLYESLAYCFVLILLSVLYRFIRMKEQSGILLGVFLCAIFSARFLLEFFKEKQAVYESELILTTGQMLSIPFLLVGIFLLILPKVKRGIKM
ncbi:MAG: prolipoprotein diacylglyceryl transferase [Desulfobacula sp.]|nr:prolipoprotein diacylglyceryl transferase [Desulfobacula sp.]